MRVVCITNRHLAEGDYEAQIQRIVAARPWALILREKDLPGPEYEKLAARVMSVCAGTSVLCILHTYVREAIRLKAEAIHLSMDGLQALTREQAEQFRVIGASTHSVEEARLAQRLGATYITASHIYATDCKKGLPPRGLDFLREVCQAVELPVYALGGICRDNAGDCILAGAAGVCIMSECMRNNKNDVVSRFGISYTIHD